MFSKNKLLVLVIASALIMLFAGSAYGSEFEVKYVYYENEKNDIVRVDYAEALAGKEYFSGDGGILYDATVEAIRNSLGDFRDVWVAVIVPGEAELVYIDYSESLKEGLNLADAVAEKGDYYNVGDEHEPEYTYVLIVQDGSAVEKSVEDDWLEEDGIIQVWDELEEQWVVYVLLTDDLPDAADIGDVDNVQVKGKNATRDPNNPYRWGVSFEDSNWWEDGFEITEEDIILVIGGVEYSL